MTQKRRLLDKFAGWENSTRTIGYYNTYLQTKVTHSHISCRLIWKCTYFQSNLASCWREVGKERKSYTRSKEQNLCLQL